MGTSVSSGGPKGGCPLIPPWVDGGPEEPLAPPPEKPEDKPEENEDTFAAQPPIVEAPPRRFSGARASLGKYASMGDESAMHRGLGHYSNKGLGGARNAARRMAGGAAKAGTLYGTLSGSGSAGGVAQQLGLSSKELAGKSSKEIAELIVERLCPIDGTQDSEASRDAMSDAFGEFVDENPNADLTALTEEQAQQVTEMFVAEDIYRRTSLDVCQSVHKNAPTPRDAIERLEEIRDFIKGTVASCFRENAKRFKSLSPPQVSGLITRVTESVFNVFESYLQ